MRVLFTLLVTVALATSSGCFGKDDEPTDVTPTPPTGTGGGTTPTTPTSTPTSPTGSTNTTPTTPMAPTPRELCAASNDYSSMTPMPPATTAVRAADCGTVPAGYTKLHLFGNFTAGTPPVTGPVSVKVLDAAGATAATCSAPQGQAADLACDNAGTAMAGAYTLEYEGTGGISFAGSVMIS